MIRVADIEEMYAAIVNGAASVAETRFYDAGAEHQRAFHLLWSVGALSGGDPSADVLPLRAASWAPFEQALAEVLAAMSEDQYLILAVKFRPAFVQFAAQGAAGLRAEVSANSVLPPDQLLTRTQIARLGVLGWQPPTGSVHASTPERDPDGSPNFHVDLPSPVDTRALAGVVVSTLIEALDVPYPGDLTYEAFDGAGTRMLWPSLKIAGERRLPPRRPEETARSVVAQTEAVVRHLVGGDAHTDPDGDFVVSLGHSDIFVRVLTEPLAVRVWAQVLREFGDDPAILSELNRLNTELRHVRVCLLNTTVVVVEDLRAEPFDWRHLRDAVVRLDTVADHVGTELQQRFGGVTASGHHAPPPEPFSPPGYL